MKLTIIPSDGAVYENGVCYSGLSWAGTPANVHALQWVDTAGWIEYTDGTPNEDIGVLPDWALNAEAAWTQANTPKPPPPAPTPEEIQAQNKATAMSLLSATDWVELPSVINTVDGPHLTNQADFLTYRNALRMIAVTPPSTPVDPWPTKPAEQWA